MLILSMLQTGGASARGVDAFEALFRECYEPVRRFFVRQGCPEEDCRDLAQETFLRAHKSFDGFRGEASSSTWVHRIAVNVWLNKLRDANAAKRDGEEVPLPEDGLAVQTPGKQALNETIEAEQRRLLASAIDDLPPKMRRCVQLRVYQDRSYREIAEILGGTESAAKSQVSLAKGRLRSKLSGHYPELAGDPDGGRG